MASVGWGSCSIILFAKHSMKVFAYVHISWILQWKLSGLPAYRCLRKRKPAIFISNHLNFDMKSSSALEKAAMCVASTSSNSASSKASDPSVFCGKITQDVGMTFSPAVRLLQTSRLPSYSGLASGGLIFCRSSNSEAVTSLSFPSTAVILLIPCLRRTGTALTSIAAILQRG